MLHIHSRQFTSEDDTKKWVNLKLSCKWVSSKNEWIKQKKTESWKIKLSRRMNWMDVIINYKVWCYAFYKLFYGN